MDVSALLDVKPAPRAVFDRLATHRDRARFQVRAGTAWQPVTWGQFALQIRGVARWLIEHDLEPGDRVAIFAQNSVAWASAALGAQTAGAAFVPIYPASTAEQVAYILEHCEAKFVFAAGTEQLARLERARTLLGLAVEVVALEDAAWAPDAPIANDRSIRACAVRDVAAPTLVDARLGGLSPDAPAQVLYTSGTSGNPKGVPLTHRNVGINGADWLICNAPLLAEGDRDLLWLPMSHIFGFGELCMGNLLGYETYLAAPAEVLDLLPEIAPQVFFSVPAYWEKIARAIQAGKATREARREALRRVTGGRLRFCLSGGAGLKIEIKQLLHEAGILILEGYGLTETSPTLTLNLPGNFRFDTVGRVLPSVELELADDGEILARGPTVFAGYLKDPEATAAAFTPDGWFRTGDVGRWTDDGFLQIIDRKKDILVTANGKNIPPANIEARFVDDPLIERVVVYGDSRPYLVAAVWVRPDAATVPRDERDRLVAARVEDINRELARHEGIKRHFVAETPLTVENGLLTASLKLRRKAVYERMRDRFEAMYA
ncbi:MAG: long-chain fatty acid--CoA ligase [Deltaproteobacteria bacterium]|nr:long-chain fatty acid--CoA ligase [Deltaproteobacteria bacterium]